MTTPQDLSEITSSTARKRQRRDLSLSPEERLAKFETLQANAMQILSSNPDAYAAFHVRNRRRRRQSEVQKFLQKIRGQ